MTFTDLGLRQEILDALEGMGYVEPSEIQAKAIPQVLGSIQDLKAFAQTGTGKTAAFSLPIVEQVDTSTKETQAIILSPTRELAVQIGDNIKQFAKNIKNFKVTTVYGGTSIENQIRELNRGAHIVVGTPGRTVDLINRKKLKLENIQWVVLDEADEMLNMGFKEDLDKVLAVTPETKQTLLFSATFPREVEAIARNYMFEPVEISAGTKNTGSDNVENIYYQVNERTRYPALKRIADMNPNIYAIVFCRTRRETQEIADKLIADGYNAESLHGDLSQHQRDSVMQKFRNKTVQILVATDVAARGLDVNNLTHVINHKLPDQIEAYTHRSGRTGRAGNKGVSIVLANKKDVGKLRPIERKIKKKFIKKDIPTGKEICEVQLLNVVDKIQNIEVRADQLAPYQETINEKFADLSREDLIQKFMSLEFNSFLDYYANTPDLNKVEDERRDRKNSRDKNYDDENMTRFFINIGRKDQVNPARLIGLINEQNITNNIEIGQIDILDTFSFFELDKNFENQTIEAFEENEVVFEGRTVNVEITKKKKRSGGGGGRRGGGDFRGGRRSEGRRSEGNGGSRSEGRRSGGRDRRSNSGGGNDKRWGRRRS